VGASLDALHALATENRLDAIGEAGFDLFDEKFRATEKAQDGLFAEHLEIAIAQGLPMVLHVRRAMHKVFAVSQRLKKVPAVIFHSYSGTAREGGDLLKRGVNAYFSFGTTILLNHKISRQACASLPLERLLTETDAPYQPLRGASFSAWRDLPTILGGMLALRGEGLPAQELERIVCGNFFTAFLRDKFY
jgi:TatD DNase family protein